MAKLKSITKKHKNLPLADNIVLKDYTIIKKISSGGFSFVYMAKNNITNQTVAIKEYMPNSMTIRDKEDMYVHFSDDKDRSKFLNGLNHFFEEMSVISHIKHNNIINIIDYFEMNNTAYIVTPYEFGMPLSSYVSMIKSNNATLTERDVLKIFIGILEAIEVLHENNILHLDLKPNNIWLRPNREILILDFGTAIEHNTVRDQHFFTPGYAAPEQYKNHYKVLNLGIWTDYYGVGTTLYNLLSLKLPKDAIQLIKKDDGSYNNIYQECNGMWHYKILEIVDELCQLNPDKRKKININKLILDLKGLIPFNYIQPSLEKMLIES